MTDAGYAATLKAECSIRQVAGATAAIWGDRGRTSAPVTPFATTEGALAEGLRQIGFAGVPFVTDKVVVAGRRRDLDLRCIRLEGRALDYASGVVAFVLGVEELENGTTRLTVLRKLT